MTLAVHDERRLSRFLEKHCELGRVVGPGERSVADTNGVLMFFRDGSGQERCGFGLGLGKLVDELRLSGTK